MTNLNHAKMCLLILVGAKGDLRQDYNGSFLYASDLPKDCWSKPLVQVSYDRLTLTPDGAEFILENLWTERTTRELNALRQHASKRA